MRTLRFMAAFLAVSTFSSFAVAADFQPPAKGSACDIATKAFLKGAGGKGDRVLVRIEQEDDGGVSFVKDYSIDFPLGELNGLLPHLENQEEAIAYGNANGAWAVARPDGQMKVFYQSPRGCVEAFRN